MSIVYGSVCSGIEGATQAWHSLGWRPAFFSEVEKIPRAVLKHHWPDVPLHGDFTTIKAGDYEPIDLLVGGTPCQAFSVAGLRGGLGDDRGNLALEFLRLLDRLRPQWVVWENVPGVLSSTSHVAPDPCLPPDDLPEGSEWVGEDEYDADESHAFSCFLAGLSELGYGWAYRSLDAQYFGLAQRRERVFVVGCLGDQPRAAAVLFERESLSGNPPPSRKAWQGITHDVAPCLTGSGRGVERSGESRGQDPVIATAYDGNNQSGPIDVATAVAAHGVPHGRLDFESETFIAHALRGEGIDASEDGTGRGTPLVPVAFDTTQITSPTCRSQPAPGKPCHSLAAKAHPPAIAFSAKDFGADATEELAPTLRAGGHDKSHANAGVMPAIAFHARQDPTPSEEVSGALDTDGTSRAVALRGRDGGATAELGDDLAGALRSSQGGGDKPYALTKMMVRRLTPKECCRLQGVADDFLDVTINGKPLADGPKYKMLGNGFAIPVVKWIGQRIQLVMDIEHRSAA